MPAVYLLWSFSQTTEGKEDPFLTRMIKKLESWQEEYKQRDTLHTQLLQQAADDYVLFQSTSIAPTRRKVPVNNIEYVTEIILNINC